MNSYNYDDDVSEVTEIDFLSNSEYSVLPIIDDLDEVRHNGLVLTREINNINPEFNFDPDNLLNTVQYNFYNSISTIDYSNSSSLNSSQNTDVYKICNKERKLNFFSYILKLFKFRIPRI